MLDSLQEQATQVKKKNQNLENSNPNITLTLTKTEITTNESKLERTKNATLQYGSRELQKEILRNSTPQKTDPKKHIITITSNSNSKAAICRKKEMKKNYKLMRSVRRKRSERNGRAYIYLRVSNQRDPWG